MIKALILLGVVALCAAQRGGFERDRDRHDGFERDRDRHDGFENRNNNFNNGGRNWSERDRGNFRGEHDRRVAWLRAHPWAAQNQNTWNANQRAEWLAQQNQWNAFNTANPNWYQSDPSFGNWGQLGSPGLFDPSLLQSLLGR